jgi:putative ABC transport system substrate-binding protein
MNNRRKLVIALGAGALAAPFSSFAQQQGKIWRIGFLTARSRPTLSNPDIYYDAFVQGMHQLGYVEGKNIVIDYRSADGKYDRLPELVAELVHLKVDVLVPQGTPVALVVKRANVTTPIVMTAVGDAVASGIVASLSRPGGNITGITFFLPELAAKRLELLKEVMPRFTRIAILVNQNNSLMKPILQAMETAAKLLNVRLQPFEVQNTTEFNGAFSAMVNKRIDAVVIPDDATFVSNDKLIAELATQYRLPSIGYGEFAAAGGLMAYGVNRLDMFRRTAYFVDKILKGIRPADIPVELPTKFELVINMKTAKALGIKVPQTIMLRADKVIE